MDLEEFLEKGYKLVEGDVIVDVDSQSEIITLEHEHNYNRVIEGNKYIVIAKSIILESVKKYGKKVYLNEFHKNGHKLAEGDVVVDFDLEVMEVKPHSVNNWNRYDIKDNERIVVKAKALDKNSTERKLEQIETLVKSKLEHLHSNGINDFNLEAILQIINK